jgi:hypothetical protein
MSPPIVTSKSRLAAFTPFPLRLIIASLLPGKKFMRSPRTSKALLVILAVAAVIKCSCAGLSEELKSTRSSTKEADMT